MKLERKLAVLSHTAIFYIIIPNIIFYKEMYSKDTFHCRSTALSVCGEQYTQITFCVKYSKR